MPLTGQGAIAFFGATFLFLCFCLLLDLQIEDWKRREADGLEKVHSLERLRLQAQSFGGGKVTEVVQEGYRTGDGRCGFYWHPQIVAVRNDRGELIRALALSDLHQSSSVTISAEMYEGDPILRAQLLC